MIKKDWTSILVYALALALPIILTTWYCSYYLKYNAQLCNNITFFSLALSQLWHVLNLSSRKVSFLRNEVTTNYFVWAALLLCILLIGGVYWIAPLREILGLQTIEGSVWLLILAISIVPVVLIQLLKRSFKITD